MVHSFSNSLTSKSLWNHLTINFNEENMQFRKWVLKIVLQSHQNFCDSTESLDYCSFLFLIWGLFDSVMVWLFLLLVSCLIHVDINFLFHLFGRFRKWFTTIFGTTVWYVNWKIFFFSFFLTTKLEIFWRMSTLGGRFFHSWAMISNGPLSGPGSIFWASPQTNGS